MWRFDFSFSIGMSEIIPNLSKAHDTTDESYIMARLLHFNEKSDENTSVAMILEGCVAVRNYFKMRAFQLADLLDATIRKHAEEKAAYEKQAAAQLEKYKKRCAIYEQALDDLLKENNAQIAANWRNKRSLQFISDRKWRIFNI